MKKKGKSLFNYEKNKNKQTKNKQTKKKNKTITSSDEPETITELEDRPIDEVLQNKKIKFVDYARMLEILETIDQTRKSFYINNMTNGYTFQSEINNFHHLNKFYEDKELQNSQLFVSMNENIHLNLEKNNFKKNIHFDLYRIKLNFTFNMNYNGNEFRKNIGGEVIDVSFPYRDNAYFGKFPTDYENKLMVSTNYKGLNEFNVWGILNDFVETIEIESINISKPHKFEKRINRFIMIRFLEYWFRIPFRINKDLSERTFQIFNSFIKSDGYNFNTFFKKTSYRDYEFMRIKNALKRNQNIEIFNMYRKFLRAEPYQTLFKLTRKELDDAIGITETDLTSIRKLIKNHKQLYSIFFDL